MSIRLSLQRLILVTDGCPWWQQCCCLVMRPVDFIILVIFVNVYTYFLKYLGIPHMRRADVPQTVWSRAIFCFNFWGSMLLSGIAKPNFFPGISQNLRHRICKTSLTNVFLRMQSYRTWLWKLVCYFFPVAQSYMFLNSRDWGCRCLGISVYLLNLWGS